MGGVFRTPDTRRQDVLIGINNNNSIMRNNPRHLRWTRILTSNLYYYTNNNNHTRVRSVMKYVCIGNYTRNNISYTHIPAMPVTSAIPVFKNGQQNNNIDFFRPVSRRRAVKRVAADGYIQGRRLGEGVERLFVGPVAASIHTHTHTQTYTFTHKHVNSYILL